MLGRFGNVFYWFCLLIVASCLCGCLYQLVFNHVTQEDYKQYLSWGSDSWEVFRQRERGDRHNTALGFLAGAAVAWMIGKAIQYVFGGEWRLWEFLKRLK